MSDLEVTKGAAVKLPDEIARLQVVLGWDQESDDADVDAAALLLTGDRRVRSDADFVFYNQPQSADGAVRHLGRSRTDAGTQEQIAIDLDALPGDVTQVAVTASMSQGAFGQMRDLYVLVLDPAVGPLVRFEITDATVETALLFGEVYRHGDGWKFRAVGQGWDTGLAGLARDFGVTVDDEDDEAGDDGSAVADVDPAAPAVDLAAVVGATTAAVEEAILTPEDADDPDRSAAAEDDLVDVVEPVDEPGAVVIPLPTTWAGDVSIDSPGAARSVTEASAESSPTPIKGARPHRGVQTRKRPTSRVTAPTLRLAGDETWQSARLFSVLGVGGTDEQERRATSALLATMLAVKPFARGLAARCGAPAGSVEAYFEVPFRLGDRTVYPDGVLRVERAGRLWTGLLEVKTGSGQLRRDQIENYLDVARSQGFDAVITLSNEIAPGAGEHPVVVDKRKLHKTALHHLSWAEVLHEARMVLNHRGVDDPLQAWILSELIRYLSDARSGAVEYNDMGPQWVAVRDTVAAGTLRAGDRKTPEIAVAWIRLVRHLCLRLSADLGVSVSHVLPRRLATDPTARIQAVASQLATDGTLSATLRIPGAAGDLVVVADLRTAQIRCRTRVRAPQEGTSTRRLGWLLRQLKTAPDDVLVDVTFAGQTETTCERLHDVRESAAALLPDRSLTVDSFELTAASPMGPKRFGVRGAFIPSVTAAVESFYSGVVQQLRPWVAPAPALPDDLTSSASAAAVEEDDEADVAG